MHHHCSAPPPMIRPTMFLIQCQLTYQFIRSTTDHYTNLTENILSHGHNVHAPHIPLTGFRRVDARIQYLPLSSQWSLASSRATLRSLLLALSASDTAFAAFWTTCSPGPSALSCCPSLEDAEVEDVELLDDSPVPRSSLSLSWSKKSTLSSLSEVFYTWTWCRG